MNNTYGNIRPALINPLLDVEIFYHYQPTLNSEDVIYKNFKKIEDVNSILTNCNIEQEDVPTEVQDSVLPGMYNLSLPVSIFGRKGFYTIYIRPREIPCTIQDVGVLSTYPDINGIVIDLNDVENDYRNFFTNDGMVGYRVDYLQYDGSKLARQEYYRIVTGCNYAEAVTQNVVANTTNTKAYRFTQSGTLSFLTLTPSTSPSYKSNLKPFIGTPNQRIIFSNTKFDPVCIKIEICENDFDTLALSLDGNQVRSLDNGLVTTYNENNEIYKQWEFYTVKDNYNKNVVYEVKKQRTDNIDNSANQDELFNT